MMYADYTYYHNVYGGTLSEAEATKGLKKASRHIDTLTYNRIVGRGINSLTAFQQEVVRETCCMMCDFETANDEMINSLLTSYSLNGASMSFDGISANTTLINGVVTQKDTYAYLSQTGLTCRSLGV